MTNEKIVKELLKSAKTTELDLWCLVEVDTFQDEDDEEVVLTANHVFIDVNNKKVYLQDKEYSDDTYEFNKLPENVQKDIIYTIKETLTH